MPINVGAQIRGSSMPQPQQAGMPAPESEFARTLRTLRRSRTKLLFLLVLSLAAQLFAFTMVEWVRYFEGPERSLVGESTLGPATVWAYWLDGTLAWAKLVAIFAATVLVVVLAVSLLVTLLGRLGGTRPATLALLTAVWLWVLLLPWGRLPLDTDGGGHYSTASLGPIARFGRPEGEGTGSIYADKAAYPSGTMMARHQEMVDMRRDIADNTADAPGQTERLRREANYFGRFVAYPAVALLLVLLVAVRSRRAFAEAILGI